MLQLHLRPTGRRLTNQKQWNLTHLYHSDCLSNTPDYLQMLLTYQYITKSNKQNNRNSLNIANQTRINTLTGTATLHIVHAEIHIYRAHSFPPTTEFWVEKWNLPFTSKFWHFCRLLWNFTETEERLVINTIVGIMTWLNKLTTLWSIKNVALCFRPYLCQLLTNYENSFTDILCRQFATM